MTILPVPVSWLVNFIGQVLGDKAKAKVEQMWPWPKKQESPSAADRLSNLALEDREHDKSIQQLASEAARAAVLLKQEKKISNLSINDQLICDLIDVRPETAQQVLSYMEKEGRFHKGVDGTNIL